MSQSPQAPMTAAVAALRIAHTGKDKDMLTLPNYGGLQ